MAQTQASQSIHWLNKKLRAAAHDYVEAFLEACTIKKVDDPLDALRNTDAYPRLQKIPEVEFAVGWLHGVADAIGIEPDDLLAAVIVELKGKRGGRTVAA